MLEILATNTRDVLKLHTRYAVTKPSDTDRVISVSHRTLANPISVLLTAVEREQLLAWLAEPAPDPGRADSDFLPVLPVRCNDNGAPIYWRGMRSTDVQFEAHDLQTTMIVTKYNGTMEHALAIVIRWNGSHRTRGIRLTAQQVNELMRALEES